MTNILSESIIYNTFKSFENEGRDKKVHMEDVEKNRCYNQSKGVLNYNQVTFRPLNFTRDTKDVENCK